MAFKMNGFSGFKQDEKSIIGEETYNFVKNKNKNYIAGLSEGGSADPNDTSSRIILTENQIENLIPNFKEKEKNDPDNIFIEQYKDLDIKLDSISDGKKYYSIKKGMFE